MYNKEQQKSNLVNLHISNDDSQSDKILNAYEDVDNNMDEKNTKLCQKASQQSEDDLNQQEIKSTIIESKFQLSGEEQQFYNDFGPVNDKSNENISYSSQEQNMQVMDQKLIHGRSTPKIQKFNLNGQEDDINCDDDEPYQDDDQLLRSIQKKVGIASQSVIDKQEIDEESSDSSESYSSSSSSSSQSSDTFELPKLVASQQIFKLERVVTKQKSRELQKDQLNYLKARKSNDLLTSNQPKSSQQSRKNLLKVSTSVNMHLSLEQSQQQLQFDQTLKSSARKKRIAKQKMNQRKLIVEINVEEQNQKINQNIRENNRQLIPKKRRRVQLDIRAVKEQSDLYQMLHSIDICKSQRLASEHISPRRNESDLLALVDKIGSSEIQLDDIQCTKIVLLQNRNNLIKRDKVCTMDQMLNL